MELVMNHFDEGWFFKLSEFITSREFTWIGRRLKFDRLAGKNITPLFNDTFRAFRECKYKDLKVVMLGLDPYPQEGVADGLAFSARNHPLNPPASLRYIMNAVERDVYGGFAIGYNNEYLNPDLTRWANQGVLLINTALSTVVGETGAHIELWQPFMRHLFKTLNCYNTGVVYILIGTKAKEWRPMINEKANYVLTASHPAFAARQRLSSWDCNKVFSTTNDILEKDGKSTILW